jgi:hypothetical protein
MNDYENDDPYNFQQGYTTPQKEGTGKQRPKIINPHRPVQEPFSGNINQRGMPTYGGGNQNYVNKEEELHGFIDLDKKPHQNNYQGDTDEEMPLMEGILYLFKKKNLESVPKI